jgi:hypothetical protein
VILAFIFGDCSALENPHFAKLSSGVFNVLIVCDNMIVFEGPFSRSLFVVLFDRILIAL